MQWLISHHRLGRGTIHGYSILASSRVTHRDRGPAPLRFRASGTKFLERRAKAHPDRLRSRPAADSHPDFRPMTRSVTRFRRSSEANSIDRLERARLADAAAYRTPVGCEAEVRTSMAAASRKSTAHTVTATKSSRDGQSMFAAEHFVAISMRRQVRRFVATPTRINCAGLSTALPGWRKWLPARRASRVRITFETRWFGAATMYLAKAGPGLPPAPATTWPISRPVSGQFPSLRPASTIAYGNGLLRTECRLMLRPGPPWIRTPFDVAELTRAERPRKPF